MVHCREKILKALIACSASSADRRRKIAKSLGSDLCVSDGRLFLGSVVYHYLRSGLVESKVRTGVHGEP